MNRYRFRLQRLLDVKLNVEAKRQQEMVQCQMQLRDAQAEADMIGQRIDDLCRQLRSARIGNLDLQKQQTLADYLLRCNHELKQAINRVEECQTALKEAREMLLSAIQERKSLEKLREADMLRYQVELTRRDQAAMDEMAQRWSQHG